MNEIIPVTKSYLPDKEKFKSYIDKIYESGQLTNNGPLLKELEERLKNYLGVRNIILVANGSLALQVAYKSLNLTGEVITTPFSFVATTSTLAWEGLKPVFADINPDTFNLDPENIESLITEKTSAILPVHVFGNPCEVEKIEEVAKKHNLKVIYDGAHAFGVKYKNKSIFNYGDISTLSFHATKLFHTIEGGAIITNDDEIAHKVRLLINFGITGPDKIEGLGTNAKMNEFEAAMGLCVLNDIEDIINERKKVFERYFKGLNGIVKFQKFNSYSTRNFSYVPVLFKDEDELLKVKNKLNEKNIFPRRYFFPSLDTLKYLNSENSCSASAKISSKILCLPTFLNFFNSNQDLIINEIKV
ncbi:MAG: DegT/DnrJ/EryC1/StrS family aminotransferase [Desulfobacteraceae bacterium]